MRHGANSGRDCMRANRSDPCPGEECATRGSGIAPAAELLRDRCRRGRLGRRRRAESHVALEYEQHHRSPQRPGAVGVPVVDVTGPVGQGLGQLVERAVGGGAGGGTASAGLGGTAFALATGPGLTARAAGTGLAPGTAFGTGPGIGTATGAMITCDPAFAATSFDRVTSGLTATTGSGAGPAAGSEGAVSGAMSITSFASAR